MDEDRLKHSYNVAKRMMEIGKERNMNEKQVQELFVLGLVHDIGYEFGDSNEHNIVGGEILKNSNYKYWREVYYHGEVNMNYQSLYLDILNQADMQVNKFGNFVGYEKRLEDIKSRYGEESSVFKSVSELIEYLRNKNRREEIESSDWSR